MISNKLYSTIKKYIEISDQSLDFALDFKSKLMDLTSNAVNSQEMAEAYQNKKTEELTALDNIILTYMKSVIELCGEYKIEEKRRSQIEQHIELLQRLKEEK